jgi:DNA-binding GntR family transcriptional regulator
MQAAPPRTSLVDDAERALRDWLSPGRHRPGDRLPPEHDLAAMLGVSRGTVRTALQRLEAGGEIVRRQGSGTFVGRVASPAAFDEGLERLESYSSLARGRGVALAVRDLRIESLPLGPEAAESFELEPGTSALTISRVLLAGGDPAAIMVDVVRPGIELPGEESLRGPLERGAMVLDLLLEQGVPVAFARTRVQPRLVSARERDGRALGLTRGTAVLELEEVMHVATGEAVQHSIDLFAPGGLDLHVIRYLMSDSPAHVARG